MVRILATLSLDSKKILSKFKATLSLILGNPDINPKIKLLKKHIVMDSVGSLSFAFYIRTQKTLKTSFCISICSPLVCCVFSLTMRCDNKGWYSERESDSLTHGRLFYMWGSFHEFHHISSSFSFSSFFLLRFLLLFWSFFLDFFPCKIGEMSGEIKRLCNRNKKEREVRARRGGIVGSKIEKKRLNCRNFEESTQRLENSTVIEIREL